MIKTSLNVNPLTGQSFRVGVLFYLNVLNFIKWLYNRMTIKNNKETTKVSFFLRKFLIIARNIMNWNSFIKKYIISFHIIWYEFIWAHMSSYEGIWEYMSSYAISIYLKVCILKKIMIFSIKYLHIKKA